MIRDAKFISRDAVHAVEGAANNFTCLHPSFAKDDAVPIYDGSISIYNTDKQTNRNYLGQVRVQIKGKEVKTFSETTRKRRLTVTELNAFDKDLGVLYFVVEIKRGETKIFFRSLLPVDIDEAMKACNKSKSQSTEIVLRELYGKNAPSLDIICKNHLLHYPRQSNSKIYSFDDFDFNTKFIIPFIAPRDDPLKFALENDLYSYAEPMPGIFVPLGKTIIEGISAEIPKSISIDGKCYFTKYTLKRTKTDYIIFLGNSTEVNLTKHSYTIKLSGTLNERLDSLEFMIFASNEKRAVTLDGERTLTMFYSDDTEKLNELESFYDYLKKIRDMLDYFGVHKDIVLDKYSENQLLFLEALSNSITEIDERIKTYFPHFHIKIIEFPDCRIIVIPEHKKLYSIFGVFFMQRQFTIDMNGTTTNAISPFCLLKADMFQADNFDAEKVKESIFKHEINTISSEAYIGMLLEVIKAYDESNNAIYLDLASDIIEYLNPETSDIVFMNKCQIERRRGELSTVDKQRLEKMFGNTSNPLIPCGLNILLKRRDAFEECFQMLEDKDKKYLMKLPISKLLE